MAGVRFGPDYSRFMRGLRRLGASAEDFKEVMHKIGSKVVVDAKRLTPVKTGALRNTIRTNKAQRKSVIKAGTARVNYASFVEFGSVHNDKEGMVKSAITSNETYAATTLDRELDSLARRYGLQ